MKNMVNNVLKPVALMLMILTMMSCGKKADVPIEETPKRLLKVLSYNIRHGAPENSSVISMDNIASVIKLQNPDVVLLQEVDKNTTRAGEDQSQALGNRLKMFSYFSKSIDLNGGEYGVAILSKYKIIKFESIQLPNNATGGEQRSLALVTVDVPNLGEVIFGSVHLDLVLQNRLDQVAALTNLASTITKPFILGGDFNATPETPEIGNLKSAFTFGCSGNSCPLTFPAVKPTKSIDYLALNGVATSKFVLRSYATIPDRPESDHLPLLGVYTY